MASVSNISRIECSICANDYNTSDRKPFVTNCGHTFCEQCLKNLDRCPLERKLIVSKVANYKLMEIIDPGAAIGVKQGEIVSSVKATIAPTIAQLPPSVEEISRLYRSRQQLAANEVLSPDDLRAMNEHVRMVGESPDSPERTSAILSISNWCMNAKWIVSDSFFKLLMTGINSKKAHPEVWILVHAAYAFLQLDKMPIPDYKKVIPYLLLVKEHPSSSEAILPWKRNASLYLACFKLRGDGGCKINKEYAYREFRELRNDSLDGCFATLMYHEGQLLEENDRTRILGNVSVQYAHASKWVKAKLLYWQGMSNEKMIEEAYLLITGEAYNHEYLTTDEMKKRVEQSFRQGSPDMTYYERLLSVNLGYPEKSGSCLVM